MLKTILFLEHGQGDYNKCNKRSNICRFSDLVLPEAYHLGDKLLVLLNRYILLDILVCSIAVFFYESYVSVSW